MLLQSLRLRNFRAHEDTRVTCAPRVNLIGGPNGAGKTNLLEAIHYLCLSKSFLATQDVYALRQKAPFFELEGIFSGTHRAKLVVRLVYVPGEGKRVFLNGAPLERLADLVGTVPVVVLSPADQALTGGPPEERRRFLDNLLSQAYPAYLQDLLQYRRALRQRNELLAHLRRHPASVQPSLLESWQEELVVLGSRLIYRRLRFVQEFANFLMEAHTYLGLSAEIPRIEYVSVAPLDPEAELETIVAAYRERLYQLAPQERERGRTLAGPHRDQLVLRLNGLEVRRYASQGQHRIMGLALKLAKFFYLRARREETPLLLLDDVFDGLDRYRTQRILDLLQHAEEIQQSFVTSARLDLLEELQRLNTSENHIFWVEAGQVRESYPSLSLS
ncbi:MAG: DNA replication and repair protein RecF [Rhodothermus sp.]|nr:DNA replication and repair protein RecF [Rhodothermus sp.]